VLVGEAGELLEQPPPVPALKLFGCYGVEGHQFPIDGFAVTAGISRKRVVFVAQRGLRRVLQVYRSILSVFLFDDLAADLFADVPAGVGRILNAGADQLNLTTEAPEA
jgi:hypothetical protein